MNFQDLIDLREAGFTAEVSKRHDATVIEIAAIDPVTGDTVVIGTHEELFALYDAHPVHLQAHIANTASR